MNPDMRRTIVIAYDGSPNSKDALRLGKELCEAFDASPLVASCAAFPRYLLDAAETKRAKALTEPLLQVAKDELAPLEADGYGVVDKSPGRALNALADEIKPLAVVVGSAHRGAVGRIAAGSVAGALMNGAPCPVAIAPQGYVGRPDGRLSRIAVGVDGGRESLRALDEAVTIAERLDATLTILSVISQPPVALGASPGYPIADFSGLLEDHTAKVAEEAAGRVPASVPVVTHILEGDAPTVMAEASDDFDLMVVGSRGYGPLRRVLLGATSERLSRTSRCPLLVIPRDSESE